MRDCFSEGWASEVSFEGWVIFEPGESWRKGHSKLNKPVTTDGQYVLVQLWPEDHVVGITMGKVS